MGRQVPALHTMYVHVQATCADPNTWIRDFLLPGNSNCGRRRTGLVHPPLHIQLSYVLKNCTSLKSLYDGNFILPTKIFTTDKESAEFLIHTNSFFKNSAISKEWIIHYNIRIYCNITDNYDKHLGPLHNEISLKNKTFIVHTWCAGHSGTADFRTATEQ